MNIIVKPAQNNAINFLTPNNLQDAMQIAELLADSDMVPKDYQRKPGNILVALQWAAEIGLHPLQALQNIAVINGRPSIWGDAMLALVRSSGLLDFIKEEISDDGQEATCTVKRKNENPVISKFSMEDAKKAGLSGKQGPWTQYPKRMIKLRARSYALRDVFPDILKGMAIAEEEKDKEIDITPLGKTSETQIKSDKGSAALKARIAKKQAVESVAIQVNLDPFYSSIDLAQSLEELEQIGVEIADLNLGEPSKSEIGEAFKAKRKELKNALKFSNESVQAVIDEINSTSNLNQLNTVMTKLFEPFTAQMIESQRDQINCAYEAQEAALTA